MKSKMINIKIGFTLIELLGVIIIIAVISIIATPIILDLIDDVQASADLTIAKMIINEGNNYYASSLIDEEKRIKIENMEDIFPEIQLTNKPEIGSLYVNSQGFVAMAVIINERCYLKTYLGDIEIKDDLNCELGYIGPDEVNPTISQEVIGTNSNNGWYKEDIYIKINVYDNESGPLGYKRCVSNEECVPDEQVYQLDDTIYINKESAENYVCVVGLDNKGNESEKSCINYKLDKTAPETGSINIDGTKGINDWYISDVTISANNGNDQLSGHDKTVTSVTNLTNNTTGQVVTVTTTDLAGNSSFQDYIIKIDKDKPSITAKEGTIEIFEGESNDTINYFYQPNYSISGGSFSCNPVNTNTLTFGKNTITCTALGGNGLTNVIEKEIYVKSSLINTLLKQYNSSNSTGLLKNENIYYYKGNNLEVSNNYLWYKGIHWRVLEFDSNAKTITLISNQPLTVIHPASSPWLSSSAYNKSYITSWLNEVFLTSIDNSGIIDNVFNVGTSSDVSSITVTNKAGILDEEQFNRAGGQDSYLDIKDIWWLSNRASIFTIRRVNSLGEIESNPTTYTGGIRPIIKINDIVISSGNGSITDNYKTSDKSTSTSNVQVGEYISVPTIGNECGNDKLCNFRVVSKDGDSVKVILNGLLPSVSKFGNEVKINTNSTVYNAVNAFASNISEQYRYLGTKTFYIGAYFNGEDFTAVKDETLSSNIGLPTVGEMFSGNDIDVSIVDKVFTDINTIENGNVAENFWIMNRYTSTNTRAIKNTGSIIEFSSSDSNGVRPVIYLKNNLQFVSGDGTAQNPYKL